MHEMTALSWTLSHNVTYCTQIMDSFPCVSHQSESCTQVYRCIQCHILYMYRYVHVLAVGGNCWASLFVVFCTVGPFLVHCVMPSVQWGLSWCTVLCRLYSGASPWCTVLCRLYSGASPGALCYAVCTVGPFHGALCYAVCTVGPLLVHCVMPSVQWGLSWCTVLCRLYSGASPGALCYAVCTTVGPLLVHCVMPSVQWGLSWCTVLCRLYPY